MFLFINKIVYSMHKTFFNGKTHEQNVWKQLICSTNTHKVMSQCFYWMCYIWTGLDSKYLKMNWIWIFTLKILKSERDDSID